MAKLTRIKDPVKVNQIEVIIECKYVPEHNHTVYADIVAGTNGMQWMFHGPVHMCGGCYMITPNTIKKEML